MARDFYTVLKEEDPYVPGYGKTVGKENALKAIAARQKADEYLSNNSRAQFALDFKNKHGRPATSEEFKNAWGKEAQERGLDPATGKPPVQTGLMDKVKEHAGAVKQWAQDNPGKAAAIGAATAAGLGALAFRKKIAEKFRKNK